MCLSCEVLMAQANLEKAPHERDLDEYPPEWQAEFSRFSEAVLDLSLRYGETVMIRIFDPRSLQGLLKVIRYGIHRYPTFIVEGSRKIVGLDTQSLEQVLQAAGAIVQTQSSNIRHSYGTQVNI